MYLFTRTTRLAPGHIRDGMEWAVGITEKVNQVTSLNVGLWASVFSPGAGSLSFGCVVESLGDLEDANAKLIVDDIFVDIANRGAAFTDGSLDDTVATFVYGGAQADAKPTHVVVVRSQLANGSFRRGVEVGIEIAERATALGGVPTSFLVANTGAYGSVAWVTAAGSLRQLEEGEAATNGDPDFLRLVDEEAGPCFVTGATDQTIWQRVV